MSYPLISVIVPIYKVEKYLTRCVDSILEQTYSNLEIILVNDGSPDNCGGMCDNYASRDARVKVIHKENGGLSDARNAGLGIASGEFIFFIDSDDFMDTDTLEYLYDVVSSNNSEIATITSNNFDEGTDYQQKELSGGDAAVVNASSAEALNRALYDEGVTLHSWGKLYHKDLFRDVRFPVGKIFEDVGTTYKLFAHANRISISPLKKYHYLLRRGSIVRSGFYPGMMDAIEFAAEMVEFSMSSQPESIRATRSYLFITAVRNVDLMNKTGQSSEYGNYMSECIEIIKRNRRNTLFDTRVSAIARIYAFSALFGHGSVMCVLEIKSIIKKIVKR